MAASCPNCGIQCAPCAGKTLVLASDGTQVCTGCLAAYEMSKGRNPNTVKTGQPSPNNHQGTAPIVHSVTYNRGG